MEPARTAVAPLSERGAQLRTPPHNFDAEVQLLGAILSNNRAFERVSDFLRPEHFMDDRHRRIFEACELLIRRGVNADPTTLRNYFEQDATLADVGGPAHLMRLAGAAATVINAAEHGRIIHDLFQRREIIQIAEDAINRAYSFDLETGAREQMDEVQNALAGLQEHDSAAGDLVPIGRYHQAAIAAAERAYQSGTGVSGLSSGLRELDKVLGGLHPGDLIVLAGRPSMGKSALGYRIARNAAVEYREALDDKGVAYVAGGAKVALFSLEMSGEQLAHRDLALTTGIPADLQRRGQMAPVHFPRMMQAASESAGLPLFVDETANLTLNQVRQRALRLKRRHGLGLIVIDYLQLLTIDAARSERRHESRDKEIGAISRGLKALAKSLAVPILALSQLSRKTEDRDDKRPQLSDLRESGNIEQDADVVAMLYRDEYYLRYEKPNRKANETDSHFSTRLTNWTEAMEKAKGIAEIIIPKNRMGAIGSARIAFDGPLTTFTDLDQERLV